MAAPRIFVPDALDEGTSVTLQADAARHLVKVLRLGQGAHVTLFNGDGHAYGAELTDVRPAVTARVTQVFPQEPVPPLRITLAQAIAKGDRMDLALQKATELGVSAIVPLWTDRTVVRLNPERLQRKVNHWRGVIRAACEQAGRNRIPTLHEPTKLRAWLDSKPEGFGLVLAPDAAHGLRALSPPGDGVVTLLVGPEGGLAPDEITAAESIGFRTLRLGPRTLRAETAPLAALAALQGLWGDLGA